MSGPLEELYQEVILDHSRRPRNRAALTGATGRATGHNPICGDRVTVSVKVEDGRVADVGFEGAGCAISQAAASLMTVSVKGKRVAEARALCETFHELITGQELPAADLAQLGRLCAFAGVTGFPLRVKCASLPWHALRAALDQGGAVSTE